MSAAVQFASVADHVLETEERLTDLIDHLLEIGQRLDSLENTLVEAAGADPLATILARLDAFDNRLAKLERHLRRPPRFRSPSSKTIARPRPAGKCSSNLQTLFNERRSATARSATRGARRLQSASRPMRRPVLPDARASDGRRDAGSDDKEPRHEKRLQPREQDQGADGRVAGAADQGQTRGRVRTPRGGKRQRGTPAARDLGQRSRSRARVAGT